MEMNAPAPKRKLISLSPSKLGNSKAIARTMSLPSATATSSSSSSTCKSQSDSSDEYPVPFLLMAGLGAVAIGTYLIRRQSSSRNPLDTDAHRSSSAASALARAWIAADPDPKTREEVSTWLSVYLSQINNSKSSSNPSSSSAQITPTKKPPFRPLLDSLDPTSTASKRLCFGTAGVRAAVAAGYDRLNALTVIGVAQAVVLTVKPSGHTVVIGYDARHSSRKFALLVAQVFHFSGATVRLFSQPVPTPLVAFDALASNAIVSLVVTASHNPPADNGIKVYDHDAIQIRPETASRVEALIPRAARPLRTYSIEESEFITLADDDPLQQVRKAYVEAIVPVVRLRSADENARAPPAVYTACHGVGYQFIQEMFHAFGLPNVIPCEAQCTPDGDFPSLPFPNPEEPGALDLAIQTARTHKASIVLANDPDADRFAGAEVAADGTVRTFSGDEIAALLTDYITTQLVHKKEVSDLSRYAVVTSTVSSKILASMARKRGFSFHESLTGFKWLNKMAVDLEAEGKIVMLTYEEAIGFNVTQNVVRDKDGISAAAIFYEMAGYLYQNKSTLSSRLREVIDECGMHIAYNGYLRLSTSSPSTQAIFDTARETGLPTQFGDAVIVSYRDLTNGVDTAEVDQKSQFPKDCASQFLTFRCARSSSNSDDCPLIIHLRGSGTGKVARSFSVSDRSEKKSETNIFICRTKDQILLRIALFHSRSQQWFWKTLPRKVGRERHRTDPGTRISPPYKIDCDWHGAR